MSHMHPSRTWRGCANCKHHKRRGQGRGHRDPVNVQRKLDVKRRYNRHFLGS